MLVVAQSCIGWACQSGDQPMADCKGEKQAVGQRCTATCAAAFRRCLGFKERLTGGNEQGHGREVQGISRVANGGCGWEGIVKAGLSAAYRGDGFHALAGAMRPSTMADRNVKGRRERIVWTDCSTCRQRLVPVVFMVE